MNIYAAGIEDVIGTIAPGPFGELNFSDILSWGVQLFFFGIGMFALIMLLLGAFNWVTSGGEEKKLADARKRITASAIGLVMSILIFVIWTFVVGPILGIYKNGLINIPTINSMCKSNGVAATNNAECCSGNIDVATGLCAP
jgi:hypothetical protein